MASERPGANATADAGHPARTRGTRAVYAGIALFALAFALQEAAAREPALVERIYSRGFYPRLAAVLGALSDMVPFALAEWIALACLALLVWAAVRRRPAGLRLGASAPVLLAVLGWVWFVFLLVWGLNYRRLPFAVSAGLDTRKPATWELMAVCQTLVAQANGLRSGLPEDAHGAMRLHDGREGMLKRAALGSEALRLTYPWLGPEGAGPKLFTASPLFSYLGITGLYMPFSAEAHVNATLPDAGLPFVAAHELAHRQGYAREDEANYLGYLACRLHPDGDFRYSGAFSASSYALSALAVVDRAAYLQLAASRSPAVARDVEAHAVWRERYRSVLGDVAHAVNNTYLQSQGVPAGVASYGLMVDLLIAEQRTAR